MANPNEKKETIRQKEQHSQEKKSFKHKNPRKRQSAKKAVRQKEEVQTREKKVNSDKLEKSIEEVVIPETELIVQRLDHSVITINGEKYEIIKDHKDAFDAQRLSERYSPILEKYDYIVADWGFEQLRLKGFYDNQNRKVPQDKKISQLEDYLYEYCNFGAPYFVLKRLDSRKNQNNSSKPNRRKKQKKKNISNRKNNYTQDFNENSNKNTTDSKRGNRSTKKKNFVQKEVTPKEKTAKPEKDTVVVKTVKDEKGSRRFNIRRNDVDRAKNKS